MSSGLASPQESKVSQSADIEKHDEYTGIVGKKCTGILCSDLSPWKILSSLVPEILHFQGEYIVQE